MKIGAIIINWNGLEDTLKCISTIRKHVKNNQIEFLIIDNNSHRDGETHGLKQIKKIRLIFNAENIGYTKAVNQGINYWLADTFNPESILLLNNDIVCSNDFIRPLVESIRENPQIGSISPKIYFANKTGTLWFNGGVIDLMAAQIMNAVEERGDSNSAADVDWISGCCNLITVSAIKSVGKFDEKMPMYVEDVDYSIRLKKSGFKTSVHRGSYIHHDVSSALGFNSLHKRHMIVMNTIYLARKHSDIFGTTFLTKYIINQIIFCINYRGLKFISALIYTFHAIVKGMIISKK